jgi:CRISPR-associated endonuclease/helicase Cas3
VLSVQAVSVWGKSVRDDQQRPIEWLPLHQHLDDAQAVAGRLVDEWLPRQVVDRIAEDLPDGLDGVRRLVCWLAAVHDVGKASPAFAVQVNTLADRMRRNGLDADPFLAVDPNRGRVRHELVGHQSVREWLHHEQGFPYRGAAQQLAVIVGSHHGLTPEDSQVSLVRNSSVLAGTEAWADVRRELLARATTKVYGFEGLGRYRTVTLSQPSQVLLTAIVVVADWISSDVKVFPALPIHTADEPVVELDEEQAAVHTARRLHHAWAQLRLPPPWSARPLGADLDVILAQRFGLREAQARPVQVAAVEVANAQQRPGMVVIEAPMGEGKTEAALLAAEQLAYRSGAGGCFVALPTQATSDAMFARVLRWMNALPPQHSGLGRSVFLAHGKAALNETYRGLSPAARYSSIGELEEGDEAIAHGWFSGRKKGVLASFVVGTIDQVLFAGLTSRYLVLRHLALAGKVVILDEVHAYDVYMSQYLDRVLHWLGAYRVPVVLLSATLPAGRRAELLAAYQGGAVGDARASIGYPVVIGTHGGGVREVAASPRTTQVQLDHHADDLDTLVSYLRERLVDGGCAVVVRNTVTRVQETAQRLEQEFGSDHVTVSHSRFLSCDRARIDRDLLRRFGPPGPDCDRPGLHLVVASQVIEQSLDIDFDVMITDLAPTDLVLQRIGRLHRHQRDRPEALRQARCALVGVQDWAGDPVRAVSGSRRVYGEHTLLRSAALLGPAARRTIALPSDISGLVQLAYETRQIGPVSWQPAMEQARTKAELSSAARAAKAQDFLLAEVSPASKSLMNWLRAGVGDADDSPQGAAQVRDGEESLEVIVVQRDQGGGLLTPPWIEAGGGEQIPLFGALSGNQARTLAACTLRLPPALCHPGIIDDVIGALESEQVDSFQETYLLKGRLVLVLDQNRTAVLNHGSAHFQLTYDPRRGLLHERL